MEAWEERLAVYQKLPQKNQKLYFYNNFSCVISILLLCAGYLQMNFRIFWEKLLCYLYRIALQLYNSLSAYVISGNLQIQAPVLCTDRPFPKPQRIYVTVEKVLFRHTMAVALLRLESLRMRPFR